MVRIPGVVAIAGPNGAGKSRLLRRVARLPEHIVLRCTHADALKSARSTADHYKDFTGTRDANRARSQLAQLETFEWTGIFENAPQVIQLESAAPSFVEAAQVPVQDLQAAGKEAKTLNWLAGRSNRAILKIQSIADDYHDSLNSNTKLSTEECERRRLRFEALDALIRHLLGTSITIDGIHDAKMFGRPMKSNDFSLGQRRLIAFAAALFESGDSGAPAIVIMDEPESHLHPEAVIHVLDRIAAVAENSQIWIATHSLPLLASLDPSSIWCMKDGEITYAGNKTKDVLLSLMGGQHNVDNLAALLSEPAAFALSNFTAECLLAPNPVEGTPNDPQMNQVAEAITGLGADPLRLVDWGAGRGRLAKTLRQLQDDGPQPSRQIEYFAYERTSVFDDDCLDAMQGLVTDPALNHFMAISDLARRFEFERANVVVMCNVLHEIDATDWISTITRDISSILDDKGHILIVEDTIMPHGELAHDKGFLVLDDIGLRKLFADALGDIHATKSTDVRYRDRLIACLVPKKLISNINTGTVRAACDWQCRHSKQRIKEIREQPLPDQSDGRALAFHLAQFANASLVLESLGMDSSSGPTDKGLDAIYEAMDRRYNTGVTDLAARHNEHQP